MIGSSSIQTSVTVKADFTSRAAQSGKSKKREKLFPMSFRVTKDERAQIRKDAENVAVSTHIRRTLLDGKTATRKPRHKKKQKQPDVDFVTLARLLSAFGESELATSMLTLALAAKSGCLPVEPELEDRLHTACDDIHDMRLALITALNVKAEDGT
jgi:hypothetical protein